ncbi:MAG TPA: universal stress protein [Fimbriimonadaceae bacterium]|nr:universal stress protein [Fimbriimonadaceae bacterium]
MRVLLGVDDAGLYRPALSLLARMDFEQGQLTLAHSVDVLYPVPMYGVAEATVGVDFVENLNRIGEESLRLASDAACAYGIRAETVLLAGAPGPALVDYADRTCCDVIAIHSDRKSDLGAMFLGSVARGLTIGAHQSILISKGSVAPTGPLTAVFATDHSPYAERALDKLIEMNPTGVRKLHVVSAACTREVGAALARNGPGGNPATREWIEAQLRRKNAEAVGRLEEAGFQASSSVLAATPQAAIKEAMASVEADLLVLGAQGHGFVHRLFIGSTSLHQVVAEPWSVFVIRPPKT